MDEYEGLQDQTVLEESATRLKWRQMFWGVIRSPKRTLELTQAKSSLVIPAITMIAGPVFNALAFALSQKDIIADQMRKQFADMPDMAPENIDETIAFGTSPAALSMGAV